MKARYKKFDQYFKGGYCGLDVCYRLLMTKKAYQLRCSQINVKLSEKMKKLREDRKWFKHLYDVRHRIKQKEQRLLRESKKQCKAFLDGWLNETEIPN